MSEAEMLRLAQVVFGPPNPLCLTGNSAADRQVTVDEYPVGEAALRLIALVESRTREACAITCSTMQERIGGWRKATPEDCAAAIRAMGKPCE